MSLKVTSLLILFLLSCLSPLLPARHVYGPAAPIIITKTTGSSTYGILPGTILTYFPTPRGYEYIEGASLFKTGDKKAAGIEKAWPKCILDNKPIHPERDKLIKESFFAPVLPLWELKYEDFTKKRAGAELRPFGAVEPPYTALPVDGLYPGDPKYPFRRTVYLHLHLPHTSDGSYATLRNWFSDIPGINPRGGPVWIAAVGDIMPGRGIDRILTDPRSSGLKIIFQDLLPLLQSQDLLLGNLETAVTQRDDPIKKSYRFRTSPEVLPALKSAGFDYLSLTNNHSFDYGLQGFLDTLENLRRVGIATSGVGQDLAESLLPWEIEIKGESIALFSMGAYPRERSGFNGAKTAAATAERPGILWAGEKQIENILSVLRKVPAETFSIVMVHAGAEWTSHPQEKEVRLYRSLITAGADVVVGSHPHYLQALEGYKGGCIAYSLGNFLFPGMEETRYGEESLLLSLGVLDGKIRYINPIPVKIEGKHVRVDTSGDILKRFLDLTKKHHFSFIAAEKD